MATKTPPIEQVADVHTWRARLVERILKVLFPLGVVVAVPSIWFALQVGLPWIVVLDVVVLAALGVLTFAPRLTYRVRAGGLAALFLVLGAALMPVVTVPGHVYLLCFPVLTALLLGLRPGLVALGVAAIVVLGINGLAVAGQPIDTAGVTDPIELLVITINFLFASTVMTVASGVLLGRVEQSLERQRTISNSLADQREDLARANTDLAREVEERLRAQATALRLATAVEQAQDAVLIADAVGRIVYANQAAEALAGTLGDGAGATSLGDLQAVGDDAFRLADALAGGRSFTGRARFWLDGDERVFDTRITPIRDDDDAGFVAVLRDRTHEHRVEERLRRAERLDALGALARGIAHDFNNTLASVLAVAEATATEPDGDRIREHMAMIVDACVRGRDLVGQMMAFGRPSDRDRHALDLRASVESSLGLLRAALPTSIHLDADLDDAVVRARPTEIDQILTNLVTNAADALTDSPGGRILVRLRMVEVDATYAAERPRLRPGVSYAVLSVADNGTGIAADVREHVFDPFFTTKAPGDGTGLGLATVHAIATSLDGEVEVDDADGGGTEFRVHLPLSDEQQVATTTIGSRAGGSVRSTARAARVLLVDDEPTLLTIGARALEQSGFAVVTASDGNEALELLEASASSFDVVVTDVTMPGASGIEVARAAARLGGVPVVLTSGFADSLQLDVDVAAFLVKPYALDELRAAIHTALGDGQ